MYKLSIVIPARNEMFVSRTVADILKNSSKDTEVIVILDGAPADPPIRKNKRVRVIYHETSIGQRAATNEAVKLSKAKYIMKVDAHCAFDKDFDKKMIADMRDDWTMAPLMRNLHAFDWVCKNGHRRYQGPSGPCLECKEPTTMDVVWIAKEHPQSTSYCFDQEPHFQYFPQYNKRPEAQGDITESMSLQGSCFMVTRKKYWELELCDESFGSWGSQGIEVACKTWLSGGKVMINHKTWYAHMFRTQGGDFSFPYPMSAKQQEAAKVKAKQLFFGNKWPKQKHNLSWLVKRFWPVPGWDEVPGHESLSLWRFNHRKGYYQTYEKTKGVVYYTDNRLDPKIMERCQKNLDTAFKGKIVTVSLKPIDFGENIVLPLERGYLTMAKQILAGLEKIDTDIVYFCEHDVLYHPSHFDFVPPRKDVFYYNMNSWLLRATDGHCLYYDHKSLSGLVAYRELLLTHYRERVRRIEELIAQGKNPRHEMRYIGFEPGTHHRPERIDDFTAEGYRSDIPNVDIKHGCNLTKNRWSQTEFRDKNSCLNWKESDRIPWWGRGRKIL
jgi:glycosyltransferase involved in cell wall biosynthesis